MRRSNAITLQDVAKEAGVTAMTVSVVLNGARSATRVSEATRSRIMEAAARLRYRPNAVARGLSRRRMDSIGVVAVIDGGELNLYFLGLLNGILETAAQLQQNTTVFSIGSWENDDTRILSFCDGRVDGIICVGAKFNPGFTDILRQCTPFVAINADHLTPEDVGLDVDNFEGARLAVSHLIKNGHRRILHLTGSLESNGGRARLEGYQQALAEAAIPYDQALVVRSHFSSNAGRNKMREILAKAPFDPLPTAVFCGSDAIASGCMDALSEHGLRVPEDISVVGFDDTLDARITTPQLTTIQQPFRELGHHAVKCLLSLIQADTDETPAREGSDASNASDVNESGATAPMTPVSSVEESRLQLFPVALVERGSVAPPPANPISPPYRR